MNNDNVIKLVNENGVPKEYGRIQDLWHLADAVGRGMNFGDHDPEQRELWTQQILEVWHMAHDLKSVVEGQDQAKLVEPKPAVDLPKDLAYVIELAGHRADMWAEFAQNESCQLDEFYECDQEELKLMVDRTDDAVTAVSAWLKDVRS